MPLTSERYDFRFLNKQNEDLIIKIEKRT